MRILFLSAVVAVAVAVAFSLSSAIEAKEIGRSVYYFSLLMIYLIWFSMYSYDMFFRTHHD